MWKVTKRRVANGLAHNMASIRTIHIDPVECATLPIQAVLKKIHSSSRGLQGREAERRLRLFGSNEITREKKRTWYQHVLAIAQDPLNVLLAVLAVVSYATGNASSAVIIAIMVCISIALRFFQEHRADRAEEKLKKMVSSHARVIRNGKEKSVRPRSIVLGDIVALSAGDLIPADLRIIEANDLCIDQSMLTGESVAVEKNASQAPSSLQRSLDSRNLCFMGSFVQNGSARAVVIAVGTRTYFGSVAGKVLQQQPENTFHIWIRSFTRLMIKIMLIIAPLVFIINGVTKGDWFEAFVFALAVGVGLTPEMLPMIMTINLGKGALDMSRKKVIVKRLDSIQSFGSMDILCTDKTGTLTQNTIVLEKHCDVNGDESETVLAHAYVNSFFQTGLKNILDKAILNHEHITLKGYAKVDEIPFDFNRRIMSVVVARENSHILIAKGAPEEIFQRCTHYAVGDARHVMNHALTPRLEAEFESLSKDGFRILAVAYKHCPSSKKTFSKDDEHSLVLLGYLAFFDPPKASARETLQELKNLGVEIKVLTGDNAYVTQKICSEVGLSVTGILCGPEMEKMSDGELSAASESINVFARVSPLDKERIIRILRANKHVVNYLGDGINDAPALRAAHVGISVDTAADIAKETADIILLEKNLGVLKDGVLEGRKIFANIIKYIKMSASSNFGNVFSVIGGSIFLPFLPMLPVQFLLNNLLYDTSQTAQPTDNVDTELLARPHQWDVGLIRRYIFCIGPISSLFDYATFALMILVFNAWNNPSLFHTGWFVESLLSQTIIIHIIRTKKIPFVQSRASLPLILTTCGVVLIGIVLPYSPYASALGFVPLPPSYWLFVGILLCMYVAMVQGVKTWIARRYALYA